jgi:hypothetical protein
MYSDAPEKLRNEITQAIGAGKAWRSVLDGTASPKAAQIPALVKQHWQTIGKHVKSPIEHLAEQEDVSIAILALIVACDAACEGIGIPSSEGRHSYFELVSEIRLGSGTLCRFVPSDSLRVLPKQHTPRSGFNIRSLTHHLALCSASEVQPVWTQTPSQKSSKTSYNILLAPWPLTNDASDFLPASRQSRQPKDFGYFDYQPRQGKGSRSLRSWVTGLFKRARQLRQDIDLVVFPECSLTEVQWKAVSAIANANDASVIAGVRRAADASGLGENALRFKVPYAWQVEAVQSKHHRWQIEKTQISAYGLGGTLDRSKSWWENIEIGKRTLNFFAIRSDLVICPLICEDLARQDPVAELVRAVGPNLVVALLMDGPQLDHRWSARYATVLADDPGSSVLTISSLGMVQLSRPRGCKPSRTVASWKDASGNFVPLEFAPGETAMILNLQFEISEEFSVDGRSDGGVSSNPILCGIHPID